jgi:hypothetical protein
MHSSLLKIDLGFSFQPSLSESVSLEFVLGMSETFMCSVPALKAKFFLC